MASALAALVAGDLKAFYSSPEWRAARLKALRRAGFRCEVAHRGCGSPVGRRGALRAIVDHIRDLRRHPALALEPANLRVLCIGCHNKRHGADRARAEAKGARLDGWPLSPDHPWNRDVRA